MSKVEYHNEIYYEQTYFVATKEEKTSITYAVGPSASTNIRESELNELKEEYADYEANFVAKKVTGKVISQIAKIAGITAIVDAGKATVEFHSDKKEYEEGIILDEALLVAERLNLEVAISEHNNGRGLDVQLYPLDGTFIKLERWRELHEKNPNLYFPEKEINAHDWYAIGEKLKEVNNEFGWKTYSYIYEGAKHGKSIESLANGEK
ncbi:hypothetical protein [Oceanobacillus sp. J11TS1]|uniref:hypothetical protein n=1 Tax=Oceanobacillus sp. J11TS1 TaxID=2807191 RepID=UPI001B242EAB|nr:hypothetical protein [Oceanobacillus sp. J11TS1]GIO23547.1 hypothetical protein J11TS1_21280 [Oceanobacillus sp. J11TS1]